LDISYRNIVCSKMTEKEINETSKLFSENYGTWSPNHSSRPNQQIRFSPKMIRENFVDKPDRSVALAYDGDQLVGHVFYLRRKGPRSTYITWMLQLVVKKEYRGNHIGTKMMQSIWGLSDSYACGLYTSNPMTIRALEEATMRPINVKLITKHFEKLRDVAYDVMDSTEWLDTYKDGIVNTSFPTNHEDLSSRIERSYRDRRFPLNKNLPEGHEWFAFTFRSQKPFVEAEKIEQYLSFSEDILKTAYSGMNMKKHPWTKGTISEVDFIESYLQPNSKILDLGCGQGRHSLELAQRGHRVCGVDFSEKHIAVAKGKQKSLNIDNARFVCHDIKTYRDNEKYDAVLCLYDVIGSYPNEEDNLKILQSAYSHLSTGGIIILSVMNSELTKKCCGRKGNIVFDIKENFTRLIKLKGSDTMQRNGDIFDGEHIMFDEKTGIYRFEDRFC